MTANRKKRKLKKTTPPVLSFGERGRGGPNAALFSASLRAGDWCWYPFEYLTQPLRVTVKTRHSQSEQPATVYPEDDGFARVEFDEPQRAVTPGQAVVLYDGDMVVGGGTITQAP